MDEIKAALISLGSRSSQWTLEAMEKYFEEVDNINLKHIEIALEKDKFQVLYEGKDLKDYDCIFAKGSFRYESVLHAISSAKFGKCYMPNSPHSHSLAHDKLLTHMACIHAGIPMPATYLAASGEEGRRILEKVRYPVVMKMPRGTQGKGVMFADSYSAAISLLDAMVALKQPIIIQEFIDTDGRDIRAIVVGDKVVASMFRIAEEGEKRANIHAGAKGEACILDKKTQKVAVDTAKVVGAEICAVDLLESVRGPLMIEVNLSPGLQGITAATGIDVADIIAKHLYERTKQWKSSSGTTASNKILKEVDAEKKGAINDMIVNAEMRGERFLLPKLITKLSQIAEEDEISISASKGRIELRKI